MGSSTAAWQVLYGVAYNFNIRIIKKNINLCMLECSENKNQNAHTRGNFESLDDRSF